MPRRHTGGRSASISASVLVVLVIVVLFVFAEAGLGTSLSSSPPADKGGRKAKDAPPEADQ